MPKVSVIIPCYNMGKYINETIDSVLNQTFMDYEIIIVNDGSTDPKTIKILSSINNPKIRVLNTSNQGTPAARNNGIKESNGKYICCLDSDDLIDSEYLKKCVTILDSDANDEYGFVTTYQETFDKKKETWETSDFDISEMLFDNCANVSSLFRRKCWEEVGGYDKNFNKENKGYEDWDFWLLIIEKGYKWFCIKEPLFFYRIRNGSRFHYSNTIRYELLRQIYEKHITIIINQIDDKNNKLINENLLNVLLGFQKIIINFNDVIININKSKSYRFLMFVKKILDSITLFVIRLFRLKTNDK